MVLPGLRHVADDRLATFADRHVLHRHFLFAAGPITLQRFHLGSKRSQQFIESAFRAVLLLNAFDMGEPACKCHRCHVDGGHLSREHGLDLIFWFNTFDD